MKHYTSRRGFTLVELLVAFAIISILVGLLLPAISKVREASSATVSRNNMKQMGLAVNLYLDTNQIYPPTVTPTPGTFFTTNASPWGNASGTVFFTLLPFIGNNEKFIYDSTFGPPTYTQFYYSTGAVTGFGFNPWTGYGNTSLKAALNQGSLSPPTNVKTFIAPLDPSIPSDIQNLNLTMTNDIIPYPVSYCYNGNISVATSAYRGINVPDDLVNGTTHTLLMFEGYAYCGEFTPQANKFTAGTTSTTKLRAGWNLDNLFMQSWSQYINNSGVGAGGGPLYHPIVQWQSLMFAPTGQWDIHPILSECNITKPQSFQKSGGLQIALYDGSVRTLIPTEENSKSDLMKYLSSGSFTSSTAGEAIAAPVEIDW